jgi:RHS repeat-associated protein
VTGTVSVVKHVAYDAFGNVTSDSATAVKSLFLFTGRPFDADTDLQNNLNRWYDLSTGRWMSVDPIGFEAGDVNLYRYVGNNVLVYGDSYGLCTSHTVKAGFDVPSGVTRALAVIGLDEIKPEIEVATKYESCEICCASCSTAKKTTISLQAYLKTKIEMPVLLPSFSLGPVTLKPLNYFVSPSVSGGGSMTYDGCSKCWSGGGCIQVAVQAGFDMKAEVNLANWIEFGGGGKAWAEVSAKFCFTCTCGGCDYTLKACAGASIQAYAYARWEGWFRTKQWKYQYSKSAKVCEGPYSLNKSAFV